MSSGLKRWDLAEIMENAFYAKKIIKVENEYYTPHEFMEATKGKQVKRIDFTIVDPEVIANRGKLKLYELMCKQLEFEKRFLGYYQNPPKWAPDTRDR